MGSCGCVIGEQIGNFKIVSQLGKGGMGEVYLGEHEKIGTRVAVKMLLPHVSANTELVERFFNEAIAVGKILHAGTGKIFDVGFHPSGRAYLVMEFLPGETLASRIRRLGKLPVAQVGELGKQISSVLEAVHKAGITHRDLKPDNIFVVPDDELACGERIKIVDFGIAKLSGIGGGMTATSSGSMGTPAYMSPEQWKNTKNVDWRADAYSLGCLAFEMVAGRPPFIATTIGEACSMHLTEQPPRLASVAAVPPSLDALIASLLEKSPEQRPATMREIANGFGAVANVSTNMASTQMSGQIAIQHTMPAAKDAATMVSGVGMSGTATDRQAIANRETLPAPEGERPSVPPPSMPSLQNAPAANTPPQPMSTTTLGGATGSAQISATSRKPRALIFAAAAVAVVGIAIVVAFAIGGRRNKTNPIDQPDNQALRAGVRKATASCVDAKPKWKCMQERAARAETPALGVALYREAIALCIDVKCRDDDRAYLTKLRDELVASLGPDTIVADVELTEVSTDDAGTVVASDVDPKASGSGTAEASAGSGSGGAATTTAGSASSTVEATTSVGSAATSAVRPQIGFLSITAINGQVTVFLDRKKLGMTPLERRRVPAGLRELRVSAPGFNIEKEITIPLGGEYREEFKLKANRNNVGSEAGGQVGGETVNSPTGVDGLGRKQSGSAADSLSRATLVEGIQKRLVTIGFCGKLGPGPVKIAIRVGPLGGIVDMRATNAPSDLSRCVMDGLRGATFPKSIRGGSIVHEFRFGAAE
jgi:serine/threonine protein kinase